MKLLPLGISNKLFYYMNAGKNAAFDVCFQFELQEKLDKNALIAAAEKTLRAFPEFSARPVLHDGTVWAMPINEKVPVLEKSEKVIRYASKETNGYPFFFQCEKYGFSFSYFHGLADFFSIWHFIRTLFYHYATLKGVWVNPDDFVRLDAKDMVSKDETERLDPYVKFMPKENVKTENQGNAPSAFIINENYYDWESPYNAGYEIVCPLQAFLRTTKEKHTSAAAFLSLLVSHAVARAYDWKESDDPILVMASANMRKYYDAKTMVNFSDATYLAYDKEIASLPEFEQAPRLREILKGQMTKEHFDNLIAQKVKFVQSLSGGDVSISEWNSRFCSPPKEGAKMPMTVALTYVGGLDLPPEYSPVVKRITRLVRCRGANLLGLNVTTYGDTMYIRSLQRFDSDAVMKDIQKELKNAGLSAEMSKIPHFQGSQLLIDELEEV